MTLKRGEGAEIPLSDRLAPEVEMCPITPALYGVTTVRLSPMEHLPSSSASVARSQLIPPDPLLLSHPRTTSPAGPGVGAERWANTDLGASSEPSRALIVELYPTLYKVWKP